MPLPQIQQLQLEPRPQAIAWGELPRRFMNPGELEVLIALLRGVLPQRVLEFGVNEGRTAKAVLMNVAGITGYQGIDVLPGYVTAKEVQRNEVPSAPGRLARDDARFELILRPRGSLDLSSRDLMPCNAAFIDGDHGWRAVMHDSALARKLVKPGGIIIWHDYHDLGTVDVRDVLEEFASAGDELTHVAGTWLVFQRIPWRAT